jgi:hypothetical protein
MACRGGGWGGSCLRVPRAIGSGGIWVAGGPSGGRSRGLPQEWGRWEPLSPMEAKRGPGAGLSTLKEVAISRKLFYEVANRCTARTVGSTARHDWRPGG